MMGFGSEEVNSNYGGYYNPPGGSYQGINDNAFGGGDSLNRNT